MVETLEGLVERAWKVYFEAVEDEGSRKYVVEPSKPILYFGNMKAFDDSGFKIVTVGVNPSYSEFPKNNSGRRFPGMVEFLRVKSSGRRHPDSDSYASSLDSYFETCPYDNWFDNYEPVLNGCGSSFYAGALNRAIHTDLCSPVATTAPWSEVEKENPSVTDRLMRGGARLWRDVVESLAPNVILASLRRDHFNKVMGLLGIQGGQKTLGREQKVVWCRARVKGKDVAVVNALKGRTPFMGLSKDGKAELGRSILDL